ncbi:MAG: hypothetical protein LQ346_005812 [Caloplaca aetnensis]|nr:MAG: hypothetical protein LQ346_005812 [Caloplaca aetnensis]
MEVLHAAPTEADFTALSTHQSQTPSSFYSGTPVLHHHSPSTTLLIPATDFKNTPAFASLAPPSQPQTNGSAHAPADDTAAAEDHQIKIEGVDVWVTSDNINLPHRPQPRHTKNHQKTKKHQPHNPIPSNNSSPPSPPARTFTQTQRPTQTSTLTTTAPIRITSPPAPTPMRCTPRLTAYRRLCRAAEAGSQRRT